MLQDYLLELQNDPIKSRICKQRVLCRTLAGNLVYVLTITSPSQNPEDVKVSIFLACARWFNLSDLGGKETHQAYLKKMLLYPCTLDCLSRQNTKCSWFFCCCCFAYLFSYFDIKDSQGLCLCMCEMLLYRLIAAAIFAQALSLLVTIISRL